MKILIEMPDNWVDFDSPTGLIPGIFRQKLPALMLEAIKEKWLSKMPPLPEITIDPEELKKAIIEELARRKAEEILL